MSDTSNPSAKATNSSSIHHDSQPTKTSFHLALKRIQLSATSVVVVCFLILITSGITSYLIVGSRKSTYPNGSIFLPMVLADIIWLWFLLLVGCLLWYIQPNIKRVNAMSTGTVNPGTGDNSNPIDGKIISPITGEHQSEIKVRESSS